MNTDTPTLSFCYFYTKKHYNIHSQLNSMLKLWICGVFFLAVRFLRTLFYATGKCGYKALWNVEMTMMIRIIKISLTSITKFSKRNLLPLKLHSVILASGSINNESQLTNFWNIKKCIKRDAHQDAQITWHSDSLPSPPSKKYQLI